MPDQPDFRLKLVKPFFFYASMAILLAAGSIAINHWSWSHGRPRWAENVGLWNPYANIVLITAWGAYVLVRRRAARK